MDTVKLTAVTAISSLFAYLEPLHGAMFVLVFVFFADMLIAIFTDLCINGKKFSPKKFLTAFFYVAVYLSIMASVYIIGERMGDGPESLFVDKATTYIFIYFYIVNIFKNLRLILPENRPIEFIEFSIGLEFVKRIPNLNEWMRREKDKTEKPENEQHQTE
jgi:hypothetical protein